MTSREAYSRELREAYTAEEGVTEQRAVYPLEGVDGTEGSVPTGAPREVYLSRRRGDYQEEAYPQVEDIVQCVGQRMVRRHEYERGVPRRGGVMVHEHTQGRRG